MTDEEVYVLLNGMVAAGLTPQECKQQLREVRAATGLTNIGLTMQAMRYAKANNLGYPRIHPRPSKPKPYVSNAKKACRKYVRTAKHKKRIALGKAALAQGANWTTLAKLLGFKTCVRAHLWWHRHVLAKEGG